MRQHAKSAIDNFINRVGQPTPENLREFFGIGTKNRYNDFVSTISENLNDICEKGLHDGIEIASI